MTRSSRSTNKELSKKGRGLMKKPKKGAQLLPYFLFLFLYFFLFLIFTFSQCVEVARPSSSR
jgi:hypothetical protein